jgi:uncharacterized protein YkwD
MAVSSMKILFTLVITLLFATGCLALSASTPNQDAGYDHALLEQINRYRLKNGLNPLQLDPALGNLARQHSQTMFNRRQTDHDGFDTRFQRSGSRLCVENVGWNYDLPVQMFEGWRRSGGHNRNMLKKGLNRAGVATVGKYVTFFACR